MSQDYNNDYTYYYQDPRITAQQQVDTYQQVQPVQSVQPVQQVEPPSTVQSWVDVKDSRYLKGFLVGAGVALVASNPTVQKAVVSGTVKLWSALQGGIEEAKEKIQDIKAEVNETE
ncbi:hypothetical protein [Maridesulfovibrio hydrothermalis]|uniref:Uncharacterized protein n=1 Tax=Maridesulfovibrio hydrothermalis AM13 = DSM 14728 TaxID=1121451 RepID=L0R850_9BACT|nr:hypothetical protein [Maridesulfovibrio hydrothermalis]CCO22909.1 conserved protein of unknown function [Maridesulfovibrio hydrothermalis AM13 = DSM 14728]